MTLIHVVDIVTSDILHITKSYIYLYIMHVIYVKFIYFSSQFRVSGYLTCDGSGCRKFFSRQTKFHKSSLEKLQAQLPVCDTLLAMDTQYFEYNHIQNNKQSTPPHNNRPKQLLLKASSYLSIGQFSDEVVAQIHVFSNEELFCLTPIHVYAYFADLAYGSLTP